MKLSASKAAKQVGVSVPTITRAIKSGRLSSEPAEGGGYLIDTSELFRVFAAVKANTNDTPDSLGHETPDLPRLIDVEVRMLRDQLALMERAMTDKDAVIADVRRERDKWQEQAERAGRLLEGPKPAVAGVASTSTLEPLAAAAEASPTMPTGRRSWWPFSKHRPAG